MSFLPSLLPKYLKFTGHVVGSVHQIPGDEHVETSDDGERDGVVDEEFYQNHGFGIGGSQVLGKRITGLEQGDVMDPELAHVRESGGGHTARHCYRPNGRGHGHRESGGEPATDGRMQLAHWVHNGKVPVGAECGQREHRHTNRNVFSRLRHFAHGQPVRPRRKLGTSGKQT